VQSDLDDFMKKVLASRDENWKKLQQYVLEEDEAVDIHGPTRLPVWGERRNYSWFIKEGFFIRSPLKVNGVTISEADRRKAEDSYLKQQKTRDRKREEGQPASISPVDKDALADASPRDMESLLLQSRQPEFMDSAYFLRFKFEEGKYAFVGKETFDGREVLRIEYYPTRLFSHEQDKQKKANDAGKRTRNQDVEATMEHMMNKVSLITLWVEPKAHQIVKYTFDNVNFDFLPVAWLLKVSDIKASMTMSQPFKDIWLPRDVKMYFSAMLATGAFDVRYQIEYHDYKQAETSSRIKIKSPGAR